LHLRLWPVLSNREAWQEIFRHAVRKCVPEEGLGVALASHEARQTQYGLHCAVRTVIKEAVLPDAHRAGLYSKRAEVARADQTRGFTQFVSGGRVPGQGADRTSGIEMEQGEPIRRERSAKRLRVVGPSTARGRFRVILPVLRFRARKAVGEDPRVLLPSGEEVTSFDALIRHRARQAHVSSRTIFRWLDRFQNGGYAALMEKPRRDRGISRIFSKRPAVVAFVVTRYLDGWNIVSIHGALRQAWMRLCRDSSPFPCLDTVREFLSAAIPARVARKVQQ